MTTGERSCVESVQADVSRITSREGAARAVEAEGAGARIDNSRGLGNVRAAEAGGERLRIPREGGTELVADRILALVRSGARVLIVCDEEKRGDIAHALERCGLEGQTLSIGRSEGARQIRSQLNQAMTLAAPNVLNSSELEDRLSTVVSRLRQYGDTLCAVTERFSPHVCESLSDTLVTRAISSSAAARVDFKALKALAPEARAELLRQAEIFDQYLQSHGSPRKNPFFGSTLEMAELPERGRLTACIARTHDAAVAYEKELGRVFGALGLNNCPAHQEVARALAALEIIAATHTNGGDDVKAVNFHSERWTRDSASIYAALERARHWRHLLEAFGTCELNHENLGRVDIEEVEKSFQRGTLSRLLSSKHANLVEQLQKISPIPDSQQERAELLARLKELRKVKLEMQKDEPLWKELLGIDYRNARGKISEIRYWQFLSQLSERIMSFMSLVDGHPERERLVKLFERPQRVYDKEQDIRKLHAARIAYEGARQEFSEVLGFRSDVHWQKPLASQAAWLQELRRGWALMPHIASFNTISKQAAHAGFGMLSSLAESHAEGAPMLRTLMESAFHESRGPSLERATIRAHAFSNVAFTDMLKQGKALLDERERMSVLQAAEVHWEQRPISACGGQAAVLANILERSPDGMLQTHLLAQAPQAVQAAKPIILATLDTVAAWISPQLRYDHLVTVGTHVAQQISSEIPMTVVEESDAREISRGPVVAENPSLAAHDRFLSYVAQTLSSRGMSVHIQPDPDIDLAIVHPQNPERYALAVRFDWRHMSDSMTAFEQCIQVPHMLRKRGWEVLTQSLLGWYWEPEERMREIEAAYESAQHGTLSERKSSDLRVTRSSAAHEASVPYRRAALSLGSYHALRRGTASGLEEVLIEALGSVIRQEGPIHVDEAFERIREGFGLREAPPDLEQAYESAMAHGVLRRIYARKGDFLYPPSQQEIAIRNRSAVRGRVRDLSMIPPEEVELAVLRTVRHSHGIRPAEAIGRSCGLLGYRSVPPGGDTLFGAAISRLCGDGVIALREGHLVFQPQHNH